MDPKNDYRELIKASISEWEAYIRRARHNGVEIQRLFDDTSQNYALVYLGWDKNRRVQKTALHLRIKEGKIWIEVDETDRGIANALLRAGVPREDIILAFHAPQLRRLEEAVLG
jgi:hypothetical protein